MQDQVAEVMAKRPNIGEDGIGRMRARQHIFKLGVIDDNICVKGPMTCYFMYSLI